MRVPERHAQAIETIAKPIFNDGVLDLSNKEKIFYHIIAPAIAVYACYESVKFYSDIGSDGTKFLPIGHFSNEFGGLAAFWSNFSLNWFFMMNTLLRARDSYYQYKYAASLGLPLSKWQIAVKLSAATGLSLLSGTVTAIIAGNNHGRYNQIETGAVSVLLSFIGSLVLEAIVIYVFNRIQNFLYNFICSREGSEQEAILTDFNKTAEGLGDYLEQKTENLKNMTNSSDEWENLKSYENYIQHVLSGTEKESFLHYPKKLNHKTLWHESIYPNLTLGNLAKIAILLILHVILQIFDKISIYGWWRTTMRDSVKFSHQRFHIKNNFVGHAVGTAIFTPFVGLTSNVVYETINDTRDLIKSGFKNSIHFIKNPAWNRETATTLPLLLLATAFTLTGYFFAYVSSNGGLCLNAEFGWKQWWNIYPSALTTTMYNGFGFLQIAKAGFMLSVSYLVYSSSKRTVLNKHSQVTSFFSNYPKAVDQLAGEEYPNLIQQSDYSTYNTV